MVPPPPQFESFVQMLYPSPALGATAAPVNPVKNLEDPSWSEPLDPTNVPNQKEISERYSMEWEQGLNCGVDFMILMTHGKHVYPYHSPELLAKVPTAPTAHDDKVLLFQSKTYLGYPVNCELDLPEAVKTVTAVTARTATITAHRGNNPASKFMPVPTLGTTRAHTKLVFVPYPVRHFHDQPRDYEFYLNEIEPFIAKYSLEDECKNYMGYWTMHAHCEAGTPEKSILDMPVPTEANSIPVQQRRFVRVNSLRYTYSAAAAPTGPRSDFKDLVAQLDTGFAALVTSQEKAALAAKQETIRRRQESAEDKNRKVANSFGGAAKVESIRKMAGAETIGDLTPLAGSVLQMDRKADREAAVKGAGDKIALTRKWSNKVDSTFLGGEWFEKAIEAENYGIKPHETWEKIVFGNIFAYSEPTSQMKNKKSLAEAIRAFDTTITAAEALTLATGFVGLPRGANLKNYIRRAICVSEAWFGKTHWQTEFLDAALLDLDGVDDQIYTVGMMKPNEDPLRGVYLAVLVNKELRRNWQLVHDDKEPVPITNTTLFSTIVSDEIHWEPLINAQVRDAMQLDKFCAIFANDPHTADLDSATVTKTITDMTGVLLGQSQQIQSLQLQLGTRLASNPQSGSQYGSDGDSLSSLGMGSVGGQGGGAGGGLLSGKGVAINDQYCEPKFGGALAKMLATKDLNKTDPNKIISCQYIKKHAGQILPPLPMSKVPGRDGKPSQMCPAYHIFKQCNNNCGRRADHVAYAWEGPEYTGLAKWSDKCIVTQGAMQTMLTANGGKVTLE